MLAWFLPNAYCGQQPSRPYDGFAAINYQNKTALDPPGTRVSNLNKAVEPFPHRPAHRGSPSGFGMASREGRIFDSGLRMDKDAVSSSWWRVLHLRLVSR